MSRATACSSDMSSGAFLVVPMNAIPPLLASRTACVVSLAEVRLEWMDSTSSESKTR